MPKTCMWEYCAVMKALTSLQWRAGVSGTSHISHGATITASLKRDKVTSRTDSKYPAGNQAVQGQWIVAYRDQRRGLCCHTLLQRSQALGAVAPLLLFTSHPHHNKQHRPIKTPKKHRSFPHIGRSRNFPEQYCGVTSLDREPKKSRLAFPQFSSCDVDQFKIYYNTAQMFSTYNDVKPLTAVLSRERLNVCLPLPLFWTRITRT